MNNVNKIIYMAVYVMVFTAAVTLCLMAHSKLEVLHKNTLESKKYYEIYVK